MNVILWLVGFSSGFIMFVTYCFCKVSGDCSRIEEGFTN